MDNDFCYGSQSKCEYNEIKSVYIWKDVEYCYRLC